MKHVRILILESKQEVNVQKLILGALRDKAHRRFIVEDDTTLQRAAHQKMHTYQMLRALSKGFMPSTEQTIVNLRTLLASDVLNPETAGLSDSGRRLTKYSKQWLKEFIDLLGNKNDGDQIQDFIWFLLHSRVYVDVDDLVQTATSTRAKADASAGK